MSTDTNNTATAAELKAAILAKGYTLKDFAGKICVAYGTLINALNGNKPFTPALRNHIELALRVDDALGAPTAQEAPAAGMTKEGIVIYKIEIPAGKVSELCAGLNTEEERAVAIEHLIHHNLHELVELGKRCEWTEEERRQLGIASAPVAVEPGTHDGAPAPFA